MDICNIRAAAYSMTQIQSRVEEPNNIEGKETFPVEPHSTCYTLEEHRCGTIPTLLLFQGAAPLVGSGMWKGDVGSTGKVSLRTPYYTDGGTYTERQLPSEKKEITNFMVPSDNRGDKRHAHLEELLSQ